MSLTERQKREAKVMSAQGESPERIADHYGVSTSQVRRAAGKTDE